MLDMKHFRKIKRIWHNLTHPVIGEVWELHRVTPERSQDARYAPYDITPERLESLIVDYKKRGYIFVSINDIRNRILTLTTWHKAMSASKCVAVTMDDGYMDNYEYAYPIFKKYNVPFCIYVVTGYIGKKFIDRDDQPPMLTKELLIELDNDPLCTLGAHTVTHPNMTQLSIFEQEQEINESIHTLETLSGHHINNLTIPYGAKNKDTLSLLKSQDIYTQVDAWGGPVRMGVDVLRIPRYIVEEDKFVR